MAVALEIEIGALKVGDVIVELFVTFAESKL
jgi:hypothetical protein